VRRIGLAVALFLVAPLVAEFLLGNLSITVPPALLVLAPMYGGGALLARESVRRAGRGWPSLLLLGLAYGVAEEGLTTQSLFNPDYLRQQMHLLDPAHVAFLGMGAWWTVAVATYVALDAAVVLAVVAWSRRAGWGRRHELALAGGAATAYAWHAFVQQPVVGDKGLVGRVGNAVFALALLALLAAGARRARVAPVATPGAGA
jgi:hypothetical protein